MKAAGGTGGVCRPREPRCQSSVSTSHSGTMNGVPAISIQLEPENRRLAVSGDAIASASYWILSTASPSLFAISTPRGRATSRWRVSAKLIDLTLRLPANRSTCFRYTRYHYVSNLNAVRIFLISFFFWFSFKYSIFMVHAEFQRVRH